MKKQIVIISFLIIGVMATVFLNLSGCKGSTQNIDSSTPTGSTISASSIYVTSTGANTITSTADSLSNSADELFPVTSIPPEAESNVQSMDDEMSSAVESFAALNSGTASPLLEYLAAAETTSVKSTLAAYGVDFNLTAQGNTLIYSYKYLVDITLDQVKQAESQISAFNTNQVQAFKAEGVTDAAIHDIYYDKNGNLLYEQDYN